MRQLGAGLWHWEALHPDWEPSQPWQEVYGAEAPRVSSYAIDDGDRLLLFDPLAVPSEIEELAADRKPVVVLTCPWHERDTQSLVERLGAPVFVRPPDEGTPDVPWLLAGDTAEGQLFSAGDRLPVGIEAFPGIEANDLVLWVESGGAVIARHACGLRPPPRDPVRVAQRGHDARAGCRGIAPAARAAG